MVTWSLRPEKLVQFLEAAHAFELDDEPWLRRVALATRDVWGKPGALFAYFSDASDGKSVRPLLVVSEDVSDELVAIFYKSAELLSPQTMARLFRAFTAGTIRQMITDLLPALELTKAHGVADTFGIFGNDPNGLGCSVTISSGEPIDVPAADLGVYRRMAFHLAAAFRCRQRLRADRKPDAGVDPAAGAEAVLDPSGRVLHAEPPAQGQEALETLKDAARTFDRARLREGGDPLDAIRTHGPLVDARWTLVEAEGSDGKRTIAARENQATVKGLACLTDRERQVVTYLALGRSTKEIAYSLGISDSTTRVLLSRAASRLSVRTRDELVRAVTREALPGFAPIDEPT
jgi:DNA-binding CsgD family transcriptional regulator